VNPYIHSKKSTFLSLFNHSPNRRCVQITHNISRASPGRLGNLASLLSVPSSSPDQSHGRLEDSAHVSTSIRRYGGQESLAGFGSEIGFLDLAFGGVLSVSYYQPQLQKAVGGVLRCKEDLKMMDVSRSKQRATRALTKGGARMT
jgi:hypothetical protein